MLARNPASFRLIGDEDGWIRIRDIHKALLEEKLFPAMTPRSIEQHFMLFRPDGFECEDGRVRAVPGIQAPGIFTYRPASPPEMLFSVIRPRALHHVHVEGLSSSRERSWLVLHSSRKEAIVYGRRFHNQPLVCKIEAGKADRNGVRFFHAGQGLFLSKKIDRQWLILPEIKEGPDAEGRKTKSRPDKISLEGQDKVVDLRGKGTFSPSVSSFEELFQKNSGKRPRKRTRKKFKSVDKKRKKKR